MFLHGSWSHVIGNMWYLWIFGDNVEDRVGHGRFIVFYLLCGIGAALGQVAMDPASTLPTIGASGAIAGVMGAYFVLYPHSRVLTLIPWIFLQIVELPAIVLLGFWFVMQLFSAGTIAMTTQYAGRRRGVRGARRRVPDRRRRRVPVQEARARSVGADARLLERGSRTCRQQARTETQSSARRTSAGNAGHSRPTDRDDRRARKTRERERSYVRGDRRERAAASRRRATRRTRCVRRVDVCSSHVVPQRRADSVSLCLRGVFGRASAVRTSHGSGRRCGRSRRAAFPGRRRTDPAALIPCAPSIPRAASRVRRGGGSNRRARYRRAGVSAASGSR